MNGAYSDAHVFYFSVWCSSCSPIFLRFWSKQSAAAPFECQPGLRGNAKRFISHALGTSGVDCRFYPRNRDSDSSGPFRRLLQHGTSTRLGNRTETQDTFANGQGCSWSAEDGVAHTAPAHNCQVPLAWFLPEVGFFSAQLPASGTSTLLTGSANTIHWATLPPANAATDAVSLLAHIGQYNLEFSPTSFLPTRLTYSVHPDSNAGVDIPVSIEYSNYQTINGVAIPFHIQRYFNGTLSLDITMANAVIAH